jgi:hypothetical protein
MKRLFGRQYADIELCQWIGRTLNGSFRFHLELVQLFHD